MGDSAIMQLCIFCFVQFIYDTYHEALAIAQHTNLPIMRKATHFASPSIAPNFVLSAILMEQNITLSLDLT